jgi:hypothetical protein
MTVVYFDANFFYFFPRSRQVIQQLIFNFFDYWRRQVSNFFICVTYKYMLFKYMFYKLVKY